ncbi:MULTISPECIES: HAD family phosphatase [unclassified Diaminobutyricimonas]|uniref:HAD family hydrolase n=1 Tax=unclassified Diaminobutyricimonas TaxID=2643261 RepID=UPI0012F4D39F|nr:MULTISPECIES: HAD family phosphatase [unclassified Diaminobutyricimonas]
MTALFIFDMDQVLYEYDWAKRMAGLTALTGHDLSELRRRWWHETGEIAAEAGAYDADSYLEAFRRAIEFDIREEDWVGLRAGAMTPFLESIEAVREASSYGQVTLLTNNGPLAHKHLATIAPLLPDVFGDHLFASSHYGARKPDPVVFERVLEAYDTPAEQAFFADDLAVNVEAAESVGITTHLFVEPAGMHRAINEFALRKAA